MFTAIFAILFFWRASWQCDCGNNYYEDKSMVPSICQQIKEHSDKNLKVKIEIAKQWKDWAKFTANSEGLDQAYGYINKVDGKWKLIDFGTGIDNAAMDELNIPKEVR